MDIERLLRLIGKYDVSGSLVWTASLKFFVICNDLFFWAMADLEPIIDDADIDLLEQCLSDADDDGMSLYCARKRGMRPQEPAYRVEIDKKNWPLFDACGPKRDAIFGNREDQPRQESRSATDNIQQDGPAGKPIQESRSAADN